LLDGLVGQLPQLVFQGCLSLFHPFNPGLKLSLPNQSFRLPLDQPRNPALQLVALRPQTLGRLPLGTARPGLPPPPILPLQPLGIF
jgi:hypothetical protein